MHVRFAASESLAIHVEEEKIPIHHYLRQPQRLVQAIADPNLMEALSDSRFRLKMRPLNFMEIYHFQPTVILKVWSAESGTVYLDSESCDIRGIDYINDRFSFKVAGKLLATQKRDRTYLQGRADLAVKVELPPPLWLTPTPLLEMTGNRLLKSILFRIKQRLLSQLLQDYRQWASLYPEVNQLNPSSMLSPAQNPIA
jgi:hypothetical protein